MATALPAINLGTCTGLQGKVITFYSRKTQFWQKFIYFNTLNNVTGVFIPFFFNVVFYDRFSKLIFNYRVKLTDPS
jgi:hypothetical protein